MGATLANFLGQAGHSVAVLEREGSVFHQPRAIHFDAEVMRIFQSIGLAEPIERITGFNQGVRYLSASGELLMQTKRSPDKGAYGWRSAYHFYQPTLEGVLRAGVERFPNVHVSLGHDVFAVADENEQVMLRFEDRHDGSLHRLGARYVIGCDGARSLVRRVMDTTMQDLGLHQPWLVVDAQARRPLDIPRYTTQFCDPARPMTYVAGAGAHHRWEIMLMPGDDPAKMARPESVWGFLRRWVTPDDIEIERAVVYTFHSVLARGWRSECGRMLIAGDAAHQTPPFLGQGMCAGIRDCANLAWKLDLALRDPSLDALLDSYESERSPHVAELIRVAVELGGFIQTTDPKVAAERDRQLSASPKAFVPPAPPLGAGLHGESHGALGRLCPQPRLADGQLLDNHVGMSFAVIGDASFVGDAPDCAVPVIESNPSLGAWLDEIGAKAAVVRPDRYVLGVASSRAQLEALYARIPHAAPILKAKGDTR